MSKRLNGILLIILVLTMLLGANNFVFAEDSGENGDTGDEEGIIEISGVATPIRTSGDIIHEGHEFKLKIIVRNGTKNTITLSKIEFKKMILFACR